MANINPIKERVDQIFEELCNLTDNAAISEQLQSFVTSIAKFHKYSYFNSMLIMIGNPDATRVAGYGTWIKMHRYVRKGERGIPILAPIIVKDKEDPQGPAKLVGFRTVHVFDVSQTDGEPLPEPPEWRSFEVQEQLQENLLQFAASKGIQVECEDLGSDVQGYSAGNKIVLNINAGTQTLVHELAHELLHRKNPKRSERQRMEIEAESIAYIVCSYFEMPNLSAPNYLALWGADPKTIKASLQVIQTCASELIKVCYKEELQ